MSERTWEFWIDVGGTFTDCFARSPQGTVLRHKLLSSGVTKGVIAAGSSATAVLDPARRSDPPQFWIGATITLPDPNGQSIATATVAEFDSRSGKLTLESPLKTNPIVGCAYELSTGEPAPVLAVRYLLGLAPNE